MPPQLHVAQGPRNITERVFIHNIAQLRRSKHAAALQLCLRPILLLLIVELHLEPSKQLLLLGAEDFPDLLERHLPVLTLSSATAQVRPIVLTEVVTPGEGPVATWYLADIIPLIGVNCPHVTTEVLWSVESLSASSFCFRPSHQRAFVGALAKCGVNGVHDPRKVLQPENVRFPSRPLGCRA